MKEGEHNGMAADCSHSLSLDPFLFRSSHTVSLVIKDTVIRDLFNLNIFCKQMKWTCVTFRKCMEKHCKQKRKKTKRLLPLEWNYFIAMQSLAQS